MDRIRKKNRRKYREKERMNEKESIENCYRQMYLGMIEKNRDVLSEVLDDSFVLVHMTGMRQSKDEFIKAVEKGTLNYYSANHQRIEVSCYGECAAVIGQSVVNAAVFGGGPHTWRLQQKLKLVKKGDVWLITESKASTY